MKNTLYIINYFQAGGNQNGSTHSPHMGWASFKNEIDFKLIKSTAKELVIKTIEDGCPCMGDTKIFYTALKIVDGSIVGGYVGDVKSMDVLKWN